MKKYAVCAGVGGWGVVRRLYWLYWLGLSLTLVWTPAREGNTTIRLPMAQGGNAYGTEDALGGLRFENPVAVASPPGETNRLFVVERAGKIVVITNLVSPTRTLFLDIGDKVDSNYEEAGSEGLTSLVFHPDYEENGFFYVSYALQTTTDAGTGRHNRLARFTVSDSDPNAALAGTEQPLISQLDEGFGHNMNDLHFGADGYLYVPIGDEGESQDEWQNSYRIDKDYFSAILRIDVDNRAGNLPPNPHPASHGGYSVPQDNPYVGLTEFGGEPVDPDKIRTEFWAIGFRNPWRMSFDPPTGRLISGDVGQHAMEEINLVEAGGNYGWAFFEGTRPGFRGAPPPGYEHTPPVLEYEHGYGRYEGSSVIGGYVYRGSRRPELDGQYIFGDFMSGHIWMSRIEEQPQPVMQWLGTEPGLAGFGIDPRDGDLLVINHEAGIVKRLIPMSADDLPETLSAVGVFSDLTTLEPNPGVLPYEVNVPFWSDSARKKRWFSLPDPSWKIGFREEGPWDTPTGGVWIKNFEMEMTNGVPESLRRLETRILVRGDEGVYGLTYRWNEDQTEAHLVPAEGMDETLTVYTGTGATEVAWRYPSRSECLVCHTEAGGYVLGFNTPQMHRDYADSRGPKSQIEFLSEKGYFTHPVTNLHVLRPLAGLHEESVSREYRVRSYLAVNCVQCHQPGGTAPGHWDARIFTPLSEAGIVNGALMYQQSSPDNRVVSPGDPEHSMLLQRINTTGAGRMPPLATSMIDEDAVALMRDWILKDLPDYESLADWQLRFFGSTTEARAQPDADPDEDGAENQFEYLTGRDPLTADAQAWEISIAGETNDRITIHYPHLANRGFEVEYTTNLFDPLQWFPLNVPGNAPFFSSTNWSGSVQDVPSGQARFYRMRVYEP